MRIIESYNLEEAFLYEKPFMFIKGYATALGLNYTLRALPLARKFHDGQYRKKDVKINETTYKLPYVIHVLEVCSIIISVVDGLIDRKESNFTKEDLDILLTSALLHDSLEDCPNFFTHGATDIMTVYGFPREVYEIVTLVSKRSGATEPELDEYFNKIKKNRLALMVKLADRSNNVEDLYIMKPEKLHKYVYETREWIYPLISYGKTNYPEFSSGLTALKRQIRNSTENTEATMAIYEQEIKNLRDLMNEQLKLKDEEIAKLKNGKK